MIQGIGLALGAVGFALVWGAITGNSITEELLSVIGVGSAAGSASEPSRVAPYREGSGPGSDRPMSFPALPTEFPR